MISETHKFDMSHRHFSHMLMYKNLDMVDCFAERAVIQKDVKNLLDFGTEAWVGFSFTEASGLCSYARDGENALRYLEIFADAFTKENGFHMNEDYKHLGYSSVECYVMTLEANQGFVRSCADMMLQSYQGVVAGVAGRFWRYSRLFLCCGISEESLFQIFAFPETIGSVLP